MIQPDTVTAESEDQIFGRVFTADNRYLLL
jgi:hypothetical protein